MRRIRAVEGSCIFTSALTVMNGTAAWDATGAQDVTKCMDVDPFVLCDALVIPAHWKNLPKKPKTKDL